MTINGYFGWQATPQLDDANYTRCSPNLTLVIAYVALLWGGYSDGCLVRRAIRGGTARSTHWYGAAKDWRINDHVARAAAMQWMIDNHVKLGVSAIHDYFGSRIWHADRGWKAQPHSTVTGMGQAWATYFHVETTPEAWGDTRPIDKRLGALPPAPPIPPQPTTPSPGNPFNWLAVPSPAQAAADPRWLQAVLNQHWWSLVANGAPLVEDGKVGPLTVNAIRAAQTGLNSAIDAGRIPGPKLAVDGGYGKNTASAVANWVAYLVRQGK